MTVKEVVEQFSNYSPVYVVYNDEVLYNDYDTSAASYGEDKPFSEVMYERIANWENLEVRSIHFYKVFEHHWLLRIFGDNIS